MGMVRLSSTAMYIQQNSREHIFTHQSFTGIPLYILISPDFHAQILVQNIVLKLMAGIFYGKPFAEAILRVDTG